MATISHSQIDLTTADVQIGAVEVKDGSTDARAALSGDRVKVEATGSGTFNVASAGNATSSVTSVAASASNVTLLAANTNRKGASIYNDSTAVLTLKLGATASSTSLTVKLQADDYYEVPFGYTGVIDGLWASATGAARVTEVSA